MPEIAHTLYLPEASRLQESWEAALEDMRIADIAIAVAGNLLDEVPERREDDSDVTHAQHCWKWLLPSKRDPGYSFRTRYGWTREEAWIVSRLLDAQVVALRGLRPLPGFNLAGLDQLKDLRDRWKASGCP